MVTMSNDRRGGRAYRRRRPLPALALLVGLGLAGALIWNRALAIEAPVTEAVGCPPPPAAVAAAEGVAAPGTVVEDAVLADAPPISPGAVQVRVLNASGERGQAAAVADELVGLGFVPAPDVQFGDDTIYYDQNMQCFGQVRFGAAGLSAARTVGLALPCAELVQDARADAVVDVALGTAFSEVAPGPEAASLLDTLAVADPAVPPALDPDLLAAAGSANC